MVSRQQKRLPYLPTTVLAFVLLMTVANPATGQDSTAVADSLLIQELAREMEAINSQTGAATTSRSSRVSLNPQISVIGDFQGSYQSNADRNVDLVLNEMEAAISSVVDPYARADFFIAAGQEDGEFEFELEEATITTLALPYRFQVKAGKFRSTIGKINQTHPHALIFVDTPAVYANFLGEEGLNDQGVSVGWLVPNYRFFQELTVEVTRGPGESESFATSETNRLLYVGHLKNFFDLSTSSTLEVGFSGATGPNDMGFSTTLAGADITFKRKPVQFNRYHSFTLQSEAFWSRRNETNSVAIDTWGLYALASYQFLPRWFATVRLDHSDLPDNPDWNERAVSGTLTWYATEFQKIDFGFKASEVDDIDIFYSAVVRAVFIIGSHGGHEY